MIVKLFGLKDIEIMILFRNGGTQMRKNQENEDEMIQDDACLHAAPDCSGMFAGIFLGGILVVAVILYMYLYF